MTAGPSPAPAVAYGPVDVRTGTIPKLAEAVERIAAERGVAVVDVVDVLFVD